MGGALGKGALGGFTLGLVLVALLFVLPAALRDDYYELGDPLFYMGLPLVGITTAIGVLAGALVGLQRHRAQGTSEATAQSDAKQSRDAVVLMAVGAIGVCLLIVVTVTGIV